jgi:membrane protease YdiL (CAAX protease family)
MEASASRPDGSDGLRRLSIPAYIGIVGGYLFVLLVATVFTLDRDIASPGYQTTGEVVRQLVVRMVFPLAYVYAVVAILHWWRPVLVDTKPVRRWVWIVPGALIVTIATCTNYGGLAEKPAGFVVALLVGTIAIGFAEEGLCRGLGVTAFRLSGRSERSVALWTTIIFAVSHAASLIGGPLQVLSAVGAGYLYYLVRRVSGGLVLAALVHGLTDFGILSAGVVRDEVYGLAPTFLLVEITLLIIVLIGRRHIEPREATV